MKRLWTVFFITVLFLSLPHSIAHGSLQDDIKQYEQKISELQQQKNSLSKQISIFDSQIALTSLRINTIRSAVTKLSSEIDELASEISRLEELLTRRTELVLRRIPESYKRKSTSQFGMLFLSSSFSDFVARVKYLATVQEKDAALLFQLKATQNNFAERKGLREDKKLEQEKLKKQLEQESIALASQKKDKQILLTQTKNSETVYQQLLVEAKAQLAAFSGFVTSQGGISLVDANPNWPTAYYSQLDKRWGNIAIAGSYSSGSKIYSIAQAGCFISSAAMVLTHRGTVTTPANIGTNGSYFFDANFQWAGLISLGFNSPSRTTSSSLIDTYLSQNKWVIVGISYVNNANSSPFHFVVITSKNGSDYNLFDPWKGPNVSFNSNYGSNYITEVVGY